MISLRHAVKSNQENFSETQLKQNDKADAVPMGSNVAHTVHAVKKSRQWTGQEKLTYGKLLLSYLMNDLDVSCIFMEHLSSLVNRSIKETNNFHRRMLLQHRTPRFIVTHILKYHTQKRSHQTIESLPEVGLPCLIGLNEDYREIVQKLDYKEQEYLCNFIFAEDSLQQYEELSDNGQVEELDENCLESLEKTNDSFDSNDSKQQVMLENEEKGRNQFNS